MGTKIYDTQSDNYKGETVDNCHRIVHVFIFDDEIHAVYHLDEDDMFVVKETTQDVVENPNKYMWTPFIEFVNIV